MARTNLPELKRKILELVTENYLNSDQFNGYRLTQLGQSIETSIDELRIISAELIAENSISALFGDRHLNPAIKAFDDESIDDQIRKLQTCTEVYTFLYPSPEHLKDVVDEAVYADRPFTRLLALGEGQLEYKNFDLAILEHYRSDPRYHYDTNDISGSISIKSGFFEKNNMKARDEVFLQAFGFSYNDEMRRAVAVYNWDLSRLTPEHQQIWNSRILDANYKLHPDYFRTSLLGKSPTRLSIFSAFLLELKAINGISEIMERKPLFKKDFNDSEPPREFEFLIRPTLNELNNFILLLDRLISDNIDVSFFRDDVPLETEQERKDGKIVVQRKGTIKVLDEWLEAKFRPYDPAPKIEMITTFRKIRKRRQNPAHSIEADVFDMKYFHEQRELILAAYDAVRTLRLILQNFPGANKVKIIEALKEGRIWTF